MGMACTTEYFPLFLPLEWDSTIAQGQDHSYLQQMDRACTRIPVCHPLQQLDNSEYLIHLVYLR
jgi:hypothetical protein